MYSNLQIKWNSQVLNTNILKFTPLFPMEPPHFIRVPIAKTLDTDFDYISRSLCVVTRVAMISSWAFAYAIIHQK